MNGQAKSAKFRQEDFEVRSDSGGKLASPPKSSRTKAFDCPLGLLITFNVKLRRSGVRRVILSRR